MLYCNRTDLSEEINVAKYNSSKERILCHYWYFYRGFKVQNSVCNGCHDLAMLCHSLRDAAIITVKVFIIAVLYMASANLKQLIC